MPARTIVVKVGSSSVTTPVGTVDAARLEDLGAQVAGLRAAGHLVVLVTSGAIAAGWAALGAGATTTGAGMAAPPGTAVPAVPAGPAAPAGPASDGPPPRPEDTALLQAISAVGQLPLMQAWQQALARHQLHAGQVLLTPLDLVHRRQYLQARGTLAQLMALGVVPVVNENDAIADEEIRFGDNDRLAALVAHLVSADLLVLLTDAPGLLTADPRRDPHASLIEEVVEIGRDVEELAGGAGTVAGSGGMVSKLAAAKIAVWSGIAAVIADASRPGVLAASVAGGPSVGTLFRPAGRRLPARKLWIAFAVSAAGTVTVDDGARRALVERGRSLLPAGVTGVTGAFEPEDVVEVADASGQVFARGLVRYPALHATRWIGRRSTELPDGLPAEVIHRDDLVVLEDGVPGDRR